MRLVVPADLCLGSGTRESEIEKTSFSDEGEGDREMEAVDEGMANSLIALQIIGIGSGVQILGRPK